jgi:hypothetical protein
MWGINIPKRLAANDAANPITATISWTGCGPCGGVAVSVDKQCRRTLQKHVIEIIFDVPKHKIGYALRALHFHSARAIARSREPAEVASCERELPTRRTFS